MAEKVSLLSSLPTVPVADKSEQADSKIVLLSSSDKKAKQTSTTGTAKNGPELVELTPGKSADANATTTSVASTEPAESDGGSFGVALVFGSFILIFVLVAVAAAVVTRKMSAAKAVAAVAKEPVEEAEPKVEAQPKVKAESKPAPKQQKQQVDPVVEFIQSTPDPAAGPKPAAPRKPAAAANGKMPAPPKKPGIAASAATKAPNAPDGIKAPSKPKKRF